MSEVLISDRPKGFGRNSLLWKDSDEVWSETKPTKEIFQNTESMKGEIHSVMILPQVDQRRSFTQRALDAWDEFFR